MLHLLHTPAARLLRALAGTAVFVDASQFVSVTGMLAMTLGAILIVTAGADVAPRPGETVGNA